MCALQGSPTCRLGSQVSAHHCEQYCLHRVHCHATSNLRHQLQGTVAFIHPPGLCRATVMVGVGVRGANLVLGTSRGGGA